MTNVKEEVNKAFQETFKIIFGECNLELDELKEYLVSQHYMPLSIKKSKVSGKEVFLCNNKYSKDSNFISQDELSLQKPEPLDINQIKDLDSIIESLRENFNYCGNKLFGRCANIERCDNCTDSINLYNCHTILNSKNLAYCEYVRDNSENAFGSAHFLRGRFLLRFIGGDNSSRCFETSTAVNCSDIYFSYQCINCSETMFSFNVRSKKYCIGNTALERDKYLSIKKKLLAEMREYIEKHKRFYSIYDFSQKFDSIVQKPHVPKIPEEPFDILPVQKAFETTTKVILAKALGKMQNYEKFLQKRPDIVKHSKSIFGNTLYYSDYFRTGFIPKERLINADEIDYAGAAKVQIEPDDDLNSILKKASSIAFYSPELKEGNNHNNRETPIIYNGSDGYKMGDITHSKKCAYCTHASKCEAVFGSSMLINSSKYCLRCHDSNKLTACMDCDSCSNCSYCYFCHNCEGLTECMFCFNTKSLRYAIGNVEVGKEKYMKIKKMVCDEIIKRLERDGDIGFDIYNIRCYKNNHF
ncbi:MAG: hypothetical protein ABIH83_00140 [Candidatus Micrarchaeota archaeon]